MSYKTPNRTSALSTQIVMSGLQRTQLPNTIWENPLWNSCISWFIMYMSFNEMLFSLPRLLPSMLSHFPQLSWIRRLIYPDTCARGFISCSVSVLINVRGLLTCLTPDGTVCLLWQNGKVESVTCFDTGVTGLLGAACTSVCVAA